jgi:hypothetical protein
MIRVRSLSCAYRIANVTLTFAVTVSSPAATGGGAIGAAAVRAAYTGLGISAPPSFTERIEPSANPPAFA